MLSEKNDLLISVLITMGSAGLGLKLGSMMGEYLDSQIAQEVGRRSYHYWDIRLGILGIVAGIILGAVIAYFVGLNQKNKYG